MATAAAPAIGAGITAGADLLGGVAGQGAQAKSNAASGRQAAQIEPYLKQLTNFDTSGLRAAANNVLRTQGNSLDATLAQRGIYNSGSALEQHRQLTSSVLGQLAQNINTDEYQRLLGAADLIGRVPGFGYLPGSNQGPLAGIINHGANTQAPDFNLMRSMLGG